MNTNRSLQKPKSIRLEQGNSKCMGKMQQVPDMPCMNMHILWMRDKRHFQENGGIVYIFFSKEICKLKVI